MAPSVSCNCKGKINNIVVVRGSDGERRCDAGVVALCERLEYPKDGIAQVEHGRNGLKTINCAYKWTSTNFRLALYGYLRNVAFLDRMLQSSNLYNDFLHIFIYIYDILSWMIPTPANTQGSSQGHLLSFRSIVTSTVLT